MSSINYILGADSITVFVRGKSYTINKQARTFDLVLSAVKSNDEQGVFNAVNIKDTIVTALKAKSGDIRIEGNQIFFNNREVTGVIASRIFEVIRLGLDVQPMVKFLENLMTNPSKRAVDEAFGFIEACSLPITPDGHFLAYKRVGEDYKDMHSRTVLNKPYEFFDEEDQKYVSGPQGRKGEVTTSIIEGVTTVSMPRNLVNEDRDQTCSEGLHFCSYDYLNHFGGERIVVLKINPADIVSIPSDYSNSKGRCSKYQVVDELDVENNLPVKPIQDGYDNSYDTPTETSDLVVTDSEIAEIRQALKESYTLTAVAAEFNISRRTAARIRDYISPYNK